MCAWGRGGGWGRGGVGGGVGGYGVGGVRVWGWQERSIKLNACQVKNSHCELYIKI